MCLRLVGFDLFIPVAIRYFFRASSSGGGLGGLVKPLASGWCVHPSQVLGIQVFAVEDGTIR